MAVLKIAQLWPASKRRAAESMGLDAFAPEAGNPTGAAAAAFPARVGSPAAVVPGGSRRTAWMTGVIVLLATIGGGAYYLAKHPIAWPARQGSIAFETAPAGLDVVVAGKNVGKTPVKVSLPAGSYEVQLGAGDAARTFTVVVASGESLVQHYEVVSAAAAAPVNGTLRVQVEPANQPILLDGVERGTSPLSLSDVKPGDHEIAIRGEHGATKRTVHVTAGQTTSVILTSTAPAAGEGPVVTAGWLTVSSPISLQVREGGRLVGSTDVDKLMMSSGDHAVELVNDSLGFRAQRTIKVAAGKTVSLKIDLPNGTMSLNALPWADVFVDGERVGQTPIGNLSRPIGRHEVIFRNPAFGERREVVNVTTQQTARLGVDLRK